MDLNSVKSFCSACMNTAIKPANLTCLGNLLTKLYVNYFYYDGLSPHFKPKKNNRNDLINLLYMQNVTKSVSYYHSIFNNF